MNLAAQAPLWLVGILLLVLLGAALEDGWRLRISDTFPVAIIVAAILAAALIGPTLGLWQNVVLSAGLLIAGTFLFSAGLLGGGDVKLFSACGLWFDLASGWKMLVLASLAGGLLAILLLSSRSLIPKRARVWIVLRPRGGIPYGIAISAGTATLVTLMRT